MKVVATVILLLCISGVLSLQEQPKTDSFNWGLFKPQLIHAISQSQNNPLTISQAYFHNKEALLTLRYQFPKRQSDKIIYNYRVNTGEGSYAVQDVYDPLLGDLEMSQNFIRYSPEQWIDTTRDINSRDGKERDLEIGFIYAIAFEKFDFNLTESRSLNITEYKKNRITIISNDLKNKLVIEGLNLSEGFSFRGLASDEADNWDVEKLLNETGYNFNNKIEANSTIIFLKTAARMNVGAEIQVHYTPNITNHIRYTQDKYITDAMDAWFEKYFDYVFQIKSENNFDTYFKLESSVYRQLQKLTNKMSLNKRYKINSVNKYENRLTDNEMICAQQSLSNLLGGVQYSYGTLQCVQDEQNCKEYLPLFSTTPSRLGFPRPFLWDDGFHQMVSCQWDIDFCMQDIQKWFNTISFEDGWIPREQPRGAEVRSYITWLKEDNRDGNPPSFMYNLIYIQNQGYTDYVKDLVPLIEKWFQWWMKIQYVQPEANSSSSNSTSSSDVILFKWWGPSEDTNLGSGMDDWPRVENFGDKKFISKYNVDASAWAYFFSESLYKLTNNSTYAETAEKIKQSINDVLFNTTDSIYYDYLQNTTYDSTTGQNSTQYHLSTHLGYPNFLPLIVGIIEDQEVLEKQILALMNNETLWTPYGIRSLSIQDSYFGTGYNYWRGPIWINMNYLLLRTMKLTYWDKSPLVQTFYNKLRDNIISTVCGEFEERGYFFEHFNQKLDGKGAGNHPFNGWTSLVTIIITETYI